MSVEQAREERGTEWNQERRKREREESTGPRSEERRDVKRGERLGEFVLKRISQISEQKESNSKASKA